jgi:hypothetical protein
MRRLQLPAALFFGLSFSIWLGRAELHTDDAGILVGLIGTGGFLVAMVEPRRPWIWGLILPAGVILVNVWRVGHGGLPQVLGIAAFTIAIASAAAYAGAFVRRQFSHV